jgi:hypothetical protein
MKTALPARPVKRRPTLIPLASILFSIILTAPVAPGQGLTTDPVTIAVRNGDSVALDGLLREGLNLTRKNTALITAASCGNRDAVAALIAGHARVNHRNASGFTPLLYAAIRGDEAVVELLVAAKARVDYASENGLSPLMAAADHGHLAVLRALIEAKAGVGQRNQGGRTAIDLALAAGHAEAVQILRAAGAVEGSPHPDSGRPKAGNAGEAAPLDEGITIAMAPFETGDYSYQSSLAAEDFASLLQVEVQANSGGTWIERAEIQKVLQEMELQAFSLRDATHGLQLGKLTKSDLLVTGSFGVDEGHGRTLYIEVIDVPHADVLASMSMVIAGPLGAPLSVEASAVQAASKMLRSALAEAAEVRSRMKNRTRMVPVFFRNVSANSERLDFLESEIQAQFGTAGNAETRVLQLPRAGMVTGEAELVLAGLADSDPDLWQRLAEVYVWGEFSEFESTDLPFEDVKVQLTLHVATHAGEVATFEETFPVRTRDAALKAIVDKAIAAAAKAPKAAADPAARSILAASLLARAADAQKRFPDRINPATPSGQRLWRYRLGLLETACFLNPGGEEIQRELMIERWNRPAFYTTSGNLFTGRHFQGMWRQSEQWGKFVDRFGLEALDRIPHDPVTLSKLPRVSSLSLGELAHHNVYLDLPAQVCGFISKLESGFPDDLPREVRLKWLDEVAKDFQRRLKKIAETCPDKFAIQLFTLGQEALWFPDANMRADTFGLLWKLGHTQEEGDSERSNFQLLLKDAYRLAGRPGEVAGILGGTLEVPADEGTAAMESHAKLRKETADHLKSIAQSHPLARGEVKSGFRSIHLSGSLTIESAYQVFRTQDGFWAIARQRAPYASVLWYCDDKSGVPVAVDSVQVPGHQKFTCGMVTGEDLWLGTDGAGAFRLNASSRKLQVFDGKSGLPTERILTGAVAGGEVHFGGGTPESGRLGAYDQGPETWRMVGPGESPELGEITLLAAQQHRLFVVGKPRSDGSGQRNFREWDTHTRRWSDLSRIIPSDVPPNLGAGDDSSIWLASQGKLARLDLTTRTHAPTLEFRNRISSLLPDREFLWIATANTAPDPASRVVKCATKIYLVHKASGKVMGYSSLPFNAPVDSMAASGTRLWLGLRTGFGDSNALVEMDKAPLQSKPPSNWMGNPD